jgi:hypothetical protein
VGGVMDEVVGDVAHRFTVPIVRRRGVILCKTPNPRRIGSDLGCY